MEEYLLTVRGLQMDEVGKKKANNAKKDAIFEKKIVFRVVSSECFYLGSYCLPGLIIIFDSDSKEENSYSTYCTVRVFSIYRYCTYSAVEVSPRNLSIGPGMTDSEQTQTGHHGVFVVPKLKCDKL